MRTNRTTRRTFLTGLTVATVGCVGQTRQSVSDTGSGNCTIESDSPTDTVLDEYQTAWDELSEVTKVVGTPYVFETESSTGNSALSRLNCQHESVECQKQYDEAIEMFQTGEEHATDARQGFEGVQSHARTCEIEERELFEEQAGMGVEKAQAYVDGIETFIEVAQRHVDEEIVTFERTDVFDDGLERYEEGRLMDMMSGEELEQKIEDNN